MLRILGFLLKAAAWLSLCSLVGVLVVFLFARSIVVQTDEAGPADAIVVLGGSFSRPFHAADLYKQGLAPVVYVSRVARNRQQKLLDEQGIPYPLEEEVHAQVLMARGVPRNAIRFFGPGNVSTVHEAMELSAIVPQDARLILVTSQASTRRQGMIFRDAMPQALIMVQASPYVPFASPWWSDRETAKMVGSEIAKLFFYYIGARFKNDP